MANVRIYVACLAAYNHGILHGKWIDALQPPDDIMDDIIQMLANSPIPNAEEWSIHDFDGFGSYQLDEYTCIKTVSEMANLIVEHGELFIAAFDYYGDIETAVTALEDNYYGEYSSELDFATELFDDCYLHDVPETLRYYIDYHAFARDLFISDYFSVTVDQQVHVFSNC
jgi:antirestriction protein